MYKYFDFFLRGPIESLATRAGHPTVYHWSSANDYGLPETLPQAVDGQPGDGRWATTVGMAENEYTARIGTVGSSKGLAMPRAWGSMGDGSLQISV